MRPELLVNQTFNGAVNLQNGSSLSNQEWITKVASKAGTTERALEVFGKFELDTAIVQGVMEPTNALWSWIHSLY